MDIRVTESSVSVPLANLGPKVLTSLELLWWREVRFSVSFWQGFIFGFSVLCFLIMLYITFWSGLVLQSRSCLKSKFSRQFSDLWTQSKDFEVSDDQCLINRSTDRETGVTGIIILFLLLSWIKSVLRTF